MNEEEIIELVRGEVTPWRRFRGVVALVGGLVGGTLLVSLWASEPSPLPDRTNLVFGMLTLLCAAWFCFGVWATVRPAPIFAMDRLVAAWLAVAASALMTVVLVIAVGWGPAAIVGGVFVAVAALLAFRAHRTVREIARRLAG
ncbi:hypothetical protein [Nonomuraea soli]|uniref:Uncharacterized membrane-anchored protein YitT (DUF2179 family) n=1 Tax=Nonomuraea soli TaxID=1032476 RepID=A0A7W0HMP6_9ACTN|nr:hypothetical protein [Nonomuraea soli]MBA2888970.1 uncharacterized membrane-anchored protein YitT (DUF2179 family) [Nonomuraea soli]